LSRDEPVRRWHGSRLRVAGQIVHTDRVPDGTLVDLITLEPCQWGGDRVAAGTPLTLGFTATKPEAQAELDGTMQRLGAGVCRPSMS
jgi:hypothetical protein